MSEESVDKLAIPVEEIPITMTTMGLLAKTPAVPVRYNGRVNDMLAAALYGREIGIPPLLAINELYLVDGKVSMSGKLMSQLVHRQGHQLRMTVTAKATTVHAWRRDPYTKELVHQGDFQFSDADAKRAGLAEKATYKNYPMMMRTWRAVTFACRAVFADCLGGIGYTPEEVDVPEDQWDIEAVPLDDIEVIEADGVNMEIEEATMNVAEVMEVDAVRTMTDSA